MYGVGHVQRVFFQTPVVVEALARIALVAFVGGSRALS